MNTLKFKTNIKCGGCIAKVTPVLNDTKGVNRWEVDTDNPEKILSVDAEGISAEEVVKKVNEAGFRAEILE
jgi:copper chaperone